MNPAELYSKAIRPNNIETEDTEQEEYLQSQKRYWLNEPMTQQFLRWLEEYEQSQMIACRSKLTNRQTEDAIISATKSHVAKEILDYARSTAV